MDHSASTTTRASAKWSPASSSRALYTSSVLTWFSSCCPTGLTCSRGGQDCSEIQVVCSASSAEDPNGATYTTSWASSSSYATFVGKGWLVIYYAYAMRYVEDIRGSDCEEFRLEQWMNKACFSRKAHSRLRVPHLLHWTKDVPRQGDDVYTWIRIHCIREANAKGGISYNPSIHHHPMVVASLHLSYLRC